MTATRSLRRRRRRAVRLAGGSGDRSTASKASARSAARCNVTRASPPSPFRNRRCCNSRAGGWQPAVRLRRSASGQALKLSSSSAIASTTSPAMRSARFPQRLQDRGDRGQGRGGALHRRAPCRLEASSTCASARSTPAAAARNSRSPARRPRSRRASPAARRTAHRTRALDNRRASLATDKAGDRTSRHPGGHTMNRRMLMVAAACGLAAGLAAPATAQDYPTQTIRSSSRSARAAAPTSSAASSPSACRRSSAKPSWSRTAPAPAACSATRRSPIRRRTATRSASRPRARSSPR